MQSDRRPQDPPGMRIYRYSDRTGVEVLVLAGDNIEARTLIHDCLRRLKANFLENGTVSMLVHDVTKPMWFLGNNPNG